MSGGFSSAIGFLFSFFFLITAYSIIFSNYEERLALENEILKDLYDVDSYNLKSYFIENSYLVSGRIKTKIKSQNNKLKIKKNFQNCFEVTLNNEYLINNYVSIIPISNNFFFFNHLKKNQLGFIEFYFGENNIIDEKINFFDCNGYKKSLGINSSQINNFYDYKNKKIETINQNSNNRENYDLDINLASKINLSNYDGNLKIISPLKENILLDLTFDNYKQDLEDYSIKNYDVVLGTDSTEEPSIEPEISNGVILLGLNFLKILQ